MTAPDIREKLKDRNLSYLSEALSIPYGKLRRWYLGQETALNIQELQRLVEYLRR